MGDKKPDKGECVGRVEGRSIFPIRIGPSDKTPSSDYEARGDRVYMRRVGKPDNVPVGRVVDGRAYLDRC